MTKMVVVYLVVILGVPTFKNVLDYGRHIVNRWIRVIKKIDEFKVIRFFLKNFFLYKVINKMDSYTDEKIKSIVSQYKKKRERENTNYHNVLKHDCEWRKMNNEKSKEYYKKNKEVVQKKYLSNNEYIKIRNLYRYYLRENRVEDFKQKHKEKYEYLQERGYVEIDNSPPKNNIKDFFEVVDKNKEIFENE